MAQERQTLPQLAHSWNYSLDVLRAVVRGNPSLQQLGIRFGATRAFSDEEAAKIKAAYDGRKRSKAQELVTVI